MEQKKLAQLLLTTYGIPMGETLSTLNKGADLICFIAAHYFKVSVKEVLPKMRQIIKRDMFGVMYGRLPDKT